MPTEHEKGGDGYGRFGPALAIGLLLAGGATCIVVAVGQLAGFPWALLITGFLAVAAALLLRRGIIANG